MNRCERLHEAKRRRGVIVLATLSLIIASLLVAPSDTWSVTLEDALVQAVTRDEASQARVLAGEILATGNVGTIAGAVQRLVFLLDESTFRSRPASLDAWLLALKVLDPLSGTDALRRWLLDQDNRLRLAAIGGLGLLGYESATEPLVAELMRTGNPSEILQAAAHSLAEIGGVLATDALLRAYQTGNEVTKKAVASAIMASGDASLQTALKQFM